MTELEFRPITLWDRQEVETILREAGSMSCQHSFPNLWCLKEKYGTQMCIRNQVLYIRQTRRPWWRDRNMGKDRSRWRDRNRGEDRSGESGRGMGTAYFVPLGRKADCRSIRAVEHCAKKESGGFYLFGITEEWRSWVEPCLSGRYHLESDRDWYEYLYKAERLRSLSGSGLAHRRRDVCAFWRQYSGRAETEPIHRGNLEEVMDFQSRWQRENLRRNQAPGQLEGEHRSILNGLRYFEELGLRGVALRIDGRIAGYGYGADLGGNTFDIMVQKADYGYRGCNQALLRELAACRPEAEYINYEEDIGLAGLRQAKLSYKPDCLLPKYCAVPSGGVYE